MSWDVFIFCAPPQATSTEEIPADYQPPALGPAADLRRRLRDSLPQLDLSDPTWGQLDGETWSIELNIGSGDPVMSVMLHVRGGGDDVLPVVARVAAAAGGRPLDAATDRFLTGDPRETTGWHGFQRYRDFARQWVSSRPTGLRRWLTRWRASRGPRSR